MKEELTLLGSYHFARAQVLRTLLEAEGIECMLGNINLIQPDISSGIKLFVHEKDAEEAKRILAGREEPGHEHPGGLVKKYQKILLPVNFTPHSENAVMYAIGLAARLKADLKLLHTYFIPELTSVPFDESFAIQGSVTEYLDATREKAEGNLKTLTARLAEYIEHEKISGVRVEGILVKGQLGESALEVAESYKPDLIIMGTRCRENRRAQSSEVLKIMTRARVPVLLVPEDSHLDGKHHLDHVAYATDFDESDFLAIGKLLGLLAPFSLKVTCVHTGNKPDDEELKKMEGLKNYFNEIYRDLEVACSFVQNDDTLKGLELMIKKEGIDILAITTHRRNLFTRIVNPSLTRKCYFKLDIPMLVFHS